MFKKIAILLEMIKFEHTVFALPFAFMGAFLSARGVPALATFGWIILAMVGARTCAMGFNRIVDRKYDELNPRTASRALPAKEVKLPEAWAMVILAGAVFFFACYNLNQFTLILSPFALALTLFYSLTKRFTWLCHVVLGVALAFSPLGGWVAVSGSLQGFPFVLSAGVLFWVAGFDTIYACLDADFDTEIGLFFSTIAVRPQECIQDRRAISRHSLCSFCSDRDNFRVEFFLLYGHCLYRGSTFLSAYCCQPEGSFQDSAVFFYPKRPD